MTVATASPTTRTVHPWLWRWVVLAGLLLVWQLITAVFPSTYFPQPLVVLQRFAELYLPSIEHPVPPRFLSDVLPGFGRMMLGFSIAVVIGVGVGVVLGLVRPLEDFVDWILQFMRAVPPPALFPVFLVILGTGDSMRVALIAFGTVWPILLNTIEGVRSLDGGKRDTAIVYRIRPADRLFGIILPGAAPSILAGIRTSLALALILMVISEMVAATNGIGFQLLQSQRSFDTKSMWASIVALAILGYLVNLALTVVERRVLRWQRLSGKETS